jgi:L-threonylcarbamoyladenylate synthase
LLEETPANVAGTLDSLYMNDLGSTISTLRLAPDPAGVARAAAILRGGGLVAIPTETVYGLAADATRPEAVARIFAAKERPRFNPLIAHLATPEEAIAEGAFDADARALARAFWPGPLTLVVPATGRTRVCELARAGLASVALRVPAHPVARAIIAAAGVSLAAPSANRSGRVSPTDADHVLAELDGRIEAVVDAGPCAVGVESTIVACLGDGPLLLRAGGVTRAAIEAAIGRKLADRQADDGARPLAPGRLASHYAPRARLRLDAPAPLPGEAFLAFGAGGRLPTAQSLDLSESGDLTEAAARLYAYLRRLDAAGTEAIAVAPIPDSGLGEAINDRLRRAAAPRSPESRLSA